MEAKVISNSSNSVTIQVTIPIEGNLLGIEEAIQSGVNQVGCLATSFALSRFDADGSPIMVGEIKYTNKGCFNKDYQTAYGQISLSRYVYQSNAGGPTYCPLEHKGRIIQGSTPRFAKIVSSKYSESGSAQVQKDLRENHGRYVSRSLIQDISQSVGDIIADKSTWKYAVETDAESVHSIGLSLDGTCMLLCDDGYRQAMVGSISLYDITGERIYTRYTAMPPEQGKERFYESFEKEIKTVVKQFPHAVRVGVADGAADNWTFLKDYVHEQVLDFFHATEYLSSVSKAAFKRPFEADDWLKAACHQLKQEPDGANELILQMKAFLKKRITDKKKTGIQSALTYFTNHLHQMNYPDYQKRKLPIGSGVIEAACKVIIKQRLCNSGMKWTDVGAQTVLALRCFNKSENMWKQFWNKIVRMGC